MHDPNDPAQSSESFNAHDLVMGTHQAAFRGAYQGVLSGATTVIVIFGAIEATKFLIRYIQARKGAQS